MKRLLSFLLQLCPVLKNLKKWDELKATKPLYQTKPRVLFVSAHMSHAILHIPTYGET